MCAVFGRLSYDIVHVLLAFIFFFAYSLALLEPKNISMNYVANALKFVFGTLPAKSILEWNNIDIFYPDIVAHKPFFSHLGAFFSFWCIIILWIEKIY